MFTLKHGTQPGAVFNNIVEMKKLLHKTMFIFFSSFLTFFSPIVWNAVEVYLLWTLKNY